MTSSRPLCMAFAVVNLAAILTGTFLDLAHGGESFIAPVEGRATRLSIPVSMTAAAVARQAKLPPASSRPTLTLTPERVVSLEGQSVHFTATWSRPVSRASYLFEWGDGQNSRSDEPNASHSYAEQGPYTVRVLAKVVMNDRVIQIRSEDLLIIVRVDVRNLPVPMLSAHPPHPHAGEAVTFTATIYQSATPPRYRFVSPKYHFDFGDGTYGRSDTDQVTHFYVRTGVYHPSFMVGPRIGDEWWGSAPIDLTIRPRGMISRLTASAFAQWLVMMLVMAGGVAVGWHLKSRGK